MTFQEELYEL